VLPAQSGAYFDEWRETQARYLPMVEQQFAPVPVRTVPYFDKEMVGIERLGELGAALYGDTDPHQFLYRGRPYSIARSEGGYTLSLELPFTERDDISLSRSGDELVLQVGAWRRNLVLPRLLLDAQTQGAKMDGRMLRVRFAEPVRAPRREPVRR
jgi:arsenite-transporting ATPase